ncbi:MAG: fimbrillin family protein, partial [Clostridia bacterium]|nr:fimbrillin family protein [Clostridia bacterium]
VKTIYDPCPVGFMLPAGRAFTGFTTTGSNSSDSTQFNVVGSWANGWSFMRNASVAQGNYFAASGYRDGGSGALTDVSSLGYYWSFAPISQANARYLLFFSGAVGPLYNSRRSYGFSVRPCRESD